MKRFHAKTQRHKGFNPCLLSLRIKQTRLEKLCDFAALREIFLIFFTMVHVCLGASFDTDVVEYGFIDDLIEKGELQKLREHHTVGGTTIRYQQLYHGHPVIGGGITLRIGKDNQPISLYSSLALWCEHSDPVYLITSDQATKIAVQSIYLKETRGEVKVDAVILPQNGSPAASWRVLVPALEPLGDWELFVHGKTGVVILSENLLQRIDGTGLVFNPDPMTATEDSTLRDEDDAEDAIPEEAYSEVELLDIEQDDEDRYVLTGTYADTSPTDDRAAMEEPEFVFNREDDRFEEVMTYYHIDRQARYVRELGFDDLPPTPQRINVNGVAEDLSFFSPATGMITYGSGGVDDCEDADVILHEYSHALLHQILPSWRGGETGLLTEGLCDYLAGDWSLEVNRDFQPYQLYNWDGNNEFWDGRILNSDHHYPEDADRERHDAGQLWSSLLTEIRLAADDRDLWNSVVIDHLYLLGDSATVPDAAEALLAVDEEIADHYFRPYIIRGCERRGIFMRGRFSPQISHVPLGDTDQPNRARLIQAEIESHFPVNPEDVYLVYFAGDNFIDSINFERHPHDDEQFQTYFPGMLYEGAVNYYISAQDESGVTATFPPAVPDSMISFFAGPDRIPPQLIEFNPLPNSVFPSGEIVVSAHVTDNIGVTSVVLEWLDDNVEGGGTVELVSIDDDRFVGRLLWESEINSVIPYRLIAHDGRRGGTIIVARWFEIRRQAVIDDFESGSIRWVRSMWIRNDQDAFEGDWSLADRNPLTQFTPRTAVLELDEMWDLSFAVQARLTFYETHQLDVRSGERGYFEVSDNGGESWYALLQLTGNQRWWAQRHVVLDDYCGPDSPSIRVRWRTVTPFDAEARDGWKIDDVTMLIGNIVDADAQELQLVPQSITMDPYPNPVNGGLMLHYKITVPGHVELFDLNGRKMFRSPVSSDVTRFKIDTELYPAGVYWIRMSAGEEKRIRRVVIVK